MITPPKLYKEMYISSANLIIPRETYQRALQNARANKIAAEFNEYVANEPKVSFRGGKLYVMDGQHTVMARKILNGGHDVPILCKVYTGLTEEQEAELFAMQTGSSTRIHAGEKIRALVYAKNPEALAFLAATEKTGLHLSYNQLRGKNRIGCVAAALREFRSVGEEIYTESLCIIVDAWGGHKDSLRAESIQGIMEFVKLYHDEYDRKRLVARCRKYDPMHIFRNAKATGDSLPAPHKYILEVWKIYNGSGSKGVLPLKF